jgi:putative radical SAM enzyme (TIGR03279 family)
MHKIQINGVQPDSIAEELGIEAGDYLVSVNGQGIKDIFDYRFFCADSDITLEIEKKDGSTWQYEIEKDEAEDLGLDFDNSLMDEENCCRNKCVFCFIDQLPKGMRDTLYFKDDDARLSFLFGNYITMTNISEEEIDRIIRYRMSPINVSVHTTNPELRVKMLNNRFAGNILENIQRFTSQGITVNTQIVLCPGLNDGAELDRTLGDLTALYPELHSISVVPVGLTRHREGLYPLTPFNKEIAGTVVDQVEGWQKRLLEKYGSRIVYLADEIYIMAERPIPPYSDYEDFPQIENGVGMIASLSYEIEEALSDLDGQNIKPRYQEVSVAVGVSVYSFFKEMTARIEKVVQGLTIHVYPVENTFFGLGVTVTGLLTGYDLIRELKGKALGERLLLSKNMFKADSDLLLDDKTARDLEKALGVKVIIVSDDGQELLDILVQ